jgi:hypothetical protein
MQVKATSVQSNLKVWDIFHRDFDVFTATNVQSLRVNAHNRSEALLIGARSLGCLVSELKAYEVVS